MSATPGCSQGSRRRSPQGEGMPMSAAPGRPGGGLVVEAVARPYKVKQPDGGTVEMRVVTVLLVNRRPTLTNRAADLYCCVPGAAGTCVRRGAVAACRPLGG